MDLKSFSGESFDAKGWINTAFKQQHGLSSTNDHDSREKFASSMVMKLQLLISKLNVSLEEQSELIDSTMPRVLRETESIQSEADVLSSKMTFIRSEVEQVNQETGSSMRQLVQMDLLKSKSMCKGASIKYVRTHRGGGEVLKNLLLYFGVYKSTCTVDVNIPFKIGSNLFLNL